MYVGKVPIASGFLCWATYSEWAQWGPGPSSRGRFVKGWVDQPIIMTSVGPHSGLSGVLAHLAEVGSYRVR